MSAKGKRSGKVIAFPHPVESLIRVIRGQKVMLDSDLAELYGVPTYRLNEAVKRNRDRFPLRFMFQLTQAEAHSLTSQIAISKKGRGGRRHLPYVFTEHGVVMLSAVLNSERAIRMSILVVDAFVRLRELIATNKDIAARVEKLERGYEKTASILEVLIEDIERLDKKSEPVKSPSPYSRRRIGYIIDQD